jgi:hypothetical protein
MIAKTAKVTPRGAPNLIADLGVREMTGRERYRARRDQYRRCARRIAAVAANKSGNIEGMGMVCGKPAKFGGCGSTSLR